jgi:glycerophosphoryl diester phosphodiesterase
MQAQPHPVAIVSHRGGAILWPENSLLAFRGSAALAVEQLECDVHLSADGVPVVIHDARLDRTTEAAGAVAEHSASELAQLRLRGAREERVPLLADLAALLRPARQALQVELKPAPGRMPDPALLRQSLRVLDEAGLRSRTHIIAFEAELAAAALAAGGLGGVVWLFGRDTLRAIGAAGVVGVARAHGFGTVETEIAALDATMLAELRRAGLRVGVWGANQAPEIRKALELRVDLMATDDPVLALRLRNGG